MDVENRSITQILDRTLADRLDHAKPINNTSTLPQGFPAQLNHPLAWVGNDFRGTDNDEDYIYRLTEQDLAELDAAVQSFQQQAAANGLDGHQVNADNFPLPGLGPKLAAISRDIHDGRGFSVVRGLDPLRYTVEESTLIYLGVSSYIADMRARQDKKGNMLVHIIANNSTKAMANHHRHSTSTISFHTEETGDVISWFTRGVPASGGRCIISSAYTVYNVLAKNSPDVIRTLAKSDWPFAMPRFECRPVIYYTDGRLITNFGRAPLLGSPSHQRPAHLPAVSAAQRRALDLVDEVARHTEFEIQTAPGDMHFINNLAVMHRREAFVDGGDKAEGCATSGGDQDFASRDAEWAARTRKGSAHNNRRHLVRMRLRSSTHGWTIPDALAAEWKRAFDEAGTERVWHLEPMPSYFFPLRIHPN